MKNIQISKTHMRWIAFSPKKMSILINSIKKMNPLDAIALLKIDKRKASRYLAKIIQNSVDNASISLKKEKDMLQFHSIRVDKGRFLKRYRPGSRGVAKPIHRKTCHVTIEIKSKDIGFKTKRELSDDRKLNIKKIKKD